MALRIYRATVVANNNTPWKHATFHMKEHAQLQMNLAIVTKCINSSYVIYLHFVNVLRNWCKLVIQMENNRFSLRYCCMALIQFTFCSIWIKFVPLTMSQPAQKLCTFCTAQELCVVCKNGHKKKKTFKWYFQFALNNLLFLFVWICS